MDDLPVRLRAALTTAMKARDMVSVTGLRAALAAIDNAGAVAPATGPAPVSDGPIAGAARGVGAAEAERHALDDDARAPLVWAEVTDREEAAEGYEVAGRGDRAERLRAEAAALRRVMSGDRDQLARLDEPLDGRPPRT